MNPFKFLLSIVSMLTMACSYDRNFNNVIYANNSALSEITLSGSQYNDLDHYCMSIDNGTTRLNNYSVTLKASQELYPLLCKVMSGCEDEHYYEASINIIGKDLTGHSATLDNRFYCTNQIVGYQNNFNKTSLFGTRTGRVFDTDGMYDGDYGLGNVVGFDSTP